MLSSNDVNVFGLFENQEIKDCDTIQYYTYDEMIMIVQAAISAGDGRLMRACQEAKWVFIERGGSYKGGIIPFQYHKDVSNYKIMNVVNIKKPKQKTFTPIKHHNKINNVVDFIIIGSNQVGLYAAHQKIG